MRTPDKPGIVGNPANRAPRPAVPPDFVPDNPAIFSSRNDAIRGGSWGPSTHHAPCRLRQSLRRRRPSRTRLPARCVECRRLRVTVPLRRSLPRGGVHAARGRGRCLPFPGCPAQCHARRRGWRHLDGPGRRVRRGRLTPAARSGTSRDGRGRRPPRDRARRARGRARPGPGTAWPGCPRGRSRSACRTRSQRAAPAVPP